MNIAPFVFIGLLATFSLSWFGFVFKPQAEMARTGQFADPINGSIYPLARAGLAQRGAEVYRAQGCAACHTQQIRSTNEAGVKVADIARGWGTRRTVAQDFLMDQPPQLGSVRLGPDLANMGLRKGTNDMAWHYQHLLAPRSLVPKSNMPKYPYLFEERKANGSQQFGQVYSDPDKKDVVYVPTDDCHALVAYLVSLRQEGSVFEAPRAVSTNAPSGDTNAPANTNAAAAK